MTLTAEHLNYSPGLADGHCGHCSHLMQVCVTPICSAFDKRLIRSGSAIQRCVECINHDALHHNTNED